MEIMQNDYVVGCWFAADREGNDFLLTALKRGNEWEVEYRFRYIKDDKIFDSEDRKSFRTVKIPAEVPEEKVILVANKLFDFLKIKYNHKQEIKMIQGDTDKFIKATGETNWCHMKRETIH